MTTRQLLIRLTIPLALVLGAAGEAAAEDGRPLPMPVEASALPEPTEARAIPEGRDASPVPEGVEFQRGPIDPPPVQPAPAEGALLPAPMDQPVPEDARLDPAFWAARREAAEVNLARIREERRSTEDSFTQACRYVGGDRCGELRDRAWELHRQEAALEEYLEEGLREECRRAGCLPGWVRD